MNNRLCLSLSFLLLSLCGCQHYVTPNEGVQLNTMLTTLPEEAHSSREAMASTTVDQPQASFPAQLALARIQSSGYRSRTSLGYGYGDYSIVTVRDIETEEDFERITALEDLAQVVSINQLLLPEQLITDQPLRQAAQRLHADMLLAYTIDTAFFDHDDARPLSIISLGLSPTVEIRVVTTASALLMDAHTGYLYGTLESTEQLRQKTSWMTNIDAYDALRLRTERLAFEKMLTEFEQSWPKIVKQYKHSSLMSSTRSKRYHTALTASHEDIGINTSVSVPDGVRYNTTVPTSDRVHPQCVRDRVRYEGLEMGVEL